MYKRSSIAASIIWMTVIFEFSSEAKAQSSARSGNIVRVLQNWFKIIPEDLLEFFVRKSAHIGLYFVLGLLVCNVVRYYVHDTKRLLLWSMVWVSSYAAFDEVHQLLVPGRSGEVRDVVIDSVAGLAGVGFVLIVRKYRQKA